MILIDNLSFQYGQKSLFDALHLNLSPGHIYGLLGKNGAGKSTLLKLIAGLMFPQKGTIEVVGFSPKDRNPRFLKEIYMITEEFELPVMSIQQFVRLYSPFYPRFDHRLFDVYIREFKLEKEKALPALSYGQKKKFLLSFGLATDCKLLIMDEPTNGLDIPSKSQFRKVLANAIHDERSFVISTHQVRDMENLIDPIIILDEGKIVFFQEYEQVSQKLAITRQPHLPEEETVVYYESTLGGYTVVRENTSGEETRLNLEILFNAVTTNNERITHLFNN